MFPGLYIQGERGGNQEENKTEESDIDRSAAVGSSRNR